MTRLKGVVDGYRAYARSGRLLSELARSIRHVSGPLQPDLAPGEPIVFSWFKDSASYLPDFLEHHRQLGFAHFFMIDNMSKDQGPALLKSRPDVTLYHSALPFSDYKYRMRRFLVRTHGAGRWSLSCDVDELFDYPHSDRLPLGKFLAYLDAGRYTGVLSHMLEMFPNGPLNNLPNPTGRLKVDYPMYDNTGLYSEPYSHDYNRIGNPQLRHHWGGINKQVFGIDNAYISKIPLMKFSPRVLPHVTAHTSNNLFLADLTGVLYHYKFTNAFFEKAQAVVAAGSYWRGSAVYKQYLSVLQQRPDLNLAGTTARRLDGTKQLLDEGFLETSDAFEAWVSRNASPKVRQHKDIPHALAS